MVKLKGIELYPFREILPAKKTTSEGAFAISILKDIFPSSLFVLLSSSTFVRLSLHDDIKNNRTTKILPKNFFIVTSSFLLKYFSDKIY